MANAFHAPVGDRQGRDQVTYTQPGRGGFQESAEGREVVDKKGRDTEDLECDPALAVDLRTGS